MRLTVLGKSPSWQDADGACSGYLLEDGQTAVLLDCGNGVFSKLRKFRDYTTVNAVVLSHLHADHFLDLVPYSYALTYAPRQQPVPVDRWPGTDNPCRPKLYAPKGASVAFHFHAVPHFIETFAVCAESSNGGGKPTYGTDCRPTDTRVPFAH